MKAAQEMPENVTLQQQSKFIHGEMVKAHPEKVWGITATKFKPGKLSETMSICRSRDASQILQFTVGGDLWFEVFALNSKVDQAKLEELGLSIIEKTNLK